MNTQPPKTEAAAAPELAVVPEISPFELVRTAQLIAASGTKEDIQKAFPKARELLSEAASYLHDCRTETVLDFMKLGGIPFHVILASNQKNNPDEQKLLPGIGTKEGLVKRIRRYFLTTPEELLTDQQRKEFKAKTGKEFEPVIDQKGEAFIAGEYLPRRVLDEIREWRTAERKRKASAARPKRKRKVSAPPQ